MLHVLFRVWPHVVSRDVARVVACRPRVLFARVVTHHSRVQWSCVSRVLFHTWWRADSRVIRVGRARCFVCCQRAVSRVSVRRFHAVVLFRVS